MLRVSVVHAETREIEFEERDRRRRRRDADLIPTGVGDDTASGAAQPPDPLGPVRHHPPRRQQRVDEPRRDRLRRPDPGSAATAVAVLLESGITVSFSTADGPGRYREMDHWRFAARTAGTQIETLRAAPPDGIQRHYARLAIVRFPGTVLDCRIFWPPEFGDAEGDACFGCTVCVTPESHASGALTIQAAIDQIGPAGGTVCLEGGSYLLDFALVIAARNAIAVTGQGIATLLVYRGLGDAIRVQGSVDVEPRALQPLRAARRPDRAHPPSTASPP